MSMRGYKEIQKEQMGMGWNKYCDAEADRTIHLLKEDWNDFVSQFEMFKQYRLPIHSQSRIEMKI